VIVDPEPEDSEEELEMDEAEFEAQLAKKAGGPRKSRAAVSAEAVERDEDWEAPVFEKTPEQEQRLSKALAASFMFAALGGEDLPVVVKAFCEQKIVAGTTVIKQGDKVDNIIPALYVYESGKLSVYKDGQEGAVFQYNTNGQYFGDLALLYDAPRAATVVADEDCVLWSIDRSTFNYLVKDAARNAVAKRMAFLEEVPILKGLTSEEKATLCDVMNVRICLKDEVIIKAGETGREFFILESGKLEARKDGTFLMAYSPKDYFGELALLRDAPRAADVVATEMSKVLSLDSASFKRIVGSLEEKMKEHTAAYGEVEIPK
jgi:cAMP-dependent protein kinase regulator